MQIKNDTLFCQTRRRLTLLFTFVSGLIMISMSCCYLYTTEKELQQNYSLSFYNESNTIISNLKQNTTVSGSWLSQIASDSHFILALYDNNLPLDYTTSRLTKRERNAADAALGYAKKLLDDIPSSEHGTAGESFVLRKNGSEYTMHDFAVHIEHADSYHCNAARLGDSKSPLYLILLLPASHLSQQLIRQRLVLLAINALGIIFLFLFSYCFTNRLLLPLRQNQENQTAFIAAASHELRTPLTVILSCIDAADRAEDKMQKNLLEMISSEGKRMSRLIDELLLLSRSSELPPSKYQETELDTLLLNSYEAFGPLAGQKGVRLEIELPEMPLSPCQCDSQRITQLLEILLSNAISYNKRGGFVTLSLSENPNHFKIVIQDNGIGIPPEAKPHVFERFYRADSSHTHREHFGLGLCIAKEIVDSHHGSICLSDTPGGGTTVTVLLYKDIKAI